tara:strand:- start:51 stop:257 length:207 start_codon:yes stop_codon:yes gene_type:complete
MTTDKNEIDCACVLCDIGCEFTIYHTLRHQQDPKRLTDFIDKLMNEPIKEFKHPPFVDNVDTFSVFDK